MKLFILCSLFLFLLCGCQEPRITDSSLIASPNEAVIEQNTDLAQNVDYVDVSFNSYSGESNADIISFINDPWNDALYLNNNTIYRVAYIDGAHKLSHISSQYNSEQLPFVDAEEYFNTLNFTPTDQFEKSIMFLASTEEIKQCFSKNNIEQIENITIVNLDSMSIDVGYVICATTIDAAYFMTVPLSNAAYGDYIYQKIYTQEEFLVIYSPRPGRLFIDNNEKTDLLSPIIGNAYLSMDLFSFLEVLGDEYTYDENTNVLTINGNMFQFEKSANDNQYYQVKLDDEFYITSSLYYENETYTGDFLFYLDFLDTLGYAITFRYDDHSVYISKA